MEEGGNENIQNVAQRDKRKETIKEKVRGIWDISETFQLKKGRVREWDRGKI